MKNIIHIISMKRGLGGVQQSFLSYYKFAQHSSRYKHYIFSNHEVSKNYGYLRNFFKIQKNFFTFLKHIISKNSIIYLHNKLPSKKIFYLLKLLPTNNNIIFAESGTAWNIKTQDQIEIYKKNADLAKQIIVCSIATKHMLVKRFKINAKKIKLIYNGQEDPLIKKKNSKKKKLNIGFIGRLETIKGAHLFIEAANLLKKKNLIFWIAGDGDLEKELKEISKGNKNVNFIGNVKNPFDFIKNLDILVVPSIREPLGLVSIEAGLCKVPVIASNIDGIPEVISNKHSGILINPTRKINLKKYNNQKSLPNFVINPNNQKLVKPKELDPKILSKSILLLSKNKILRLKYGLKLYQHVRKRFSIKSYFKGIEDLYEQF
ncbi:glycosyltransferase family 4 protein [Candidatus Pelagibacter sp. HIMB1485]|uniref:glycosyltransferase family 4 protein n=1 Tax=Candidatus Pelagibacter sp. HIMB1485 TaxID=3415415 RepID=UPI003F82ACF1